MKLHRINYRSTAERGLAPCMQSRHSREHMSCLRQLNFTTRPQRPPRSEHCKFREASFLYLCGLRGLVVKIFCLVCPFAVPLCSLLLSRIDPDRDGAIIDELDRHMPPEHSSLNGLPEQPFEFLAKIGVHALCQLQGRRSNKGGTIPFLSTGEQRELRHNQRLA